MTSFPARSLEIWRSSVASQLGNINGAFAIDIHLTLMVSQTLEFLAEQARGSAGATGHIQRFLQGMTYRTADKPGMLYYWHPFPNAQSLFAFDLSTLVEAIRELELLTDINLSYDHFAYLADVGLGPQVALLHVNRRPFPRGYAFEIEERNKVAASFRSGEFKLSECALAAHQHYSTGMTLLAGEDGVAGLIDAAYMQFYLAAEAVLGKHDKKEAIAAGKARFGQRFDDLQRIVEHIYVVRHRYFGHAHPKESDRLGDEERAFGIAKQVLVARWGARQLIALELGRDLVSREMRLYDATHQSITFDGDVSSLDGAFALPA